MRTWGLFLIILFVAFNSYSQSSGLKVNLLASESSICAGYSVTLTANVAGGEAPFNFAWSTGETSPSIKVNKAGVYTVSITDHSAGSRPVSQSITVVTATTPPAPKVKNQIVCENGVATLIATAPGGTYQWYDAPVGGNFLATGNTYTTPQLTTNKTYYVQTTLTGCTSPRTAVTVSIAGKPRATGASVCQGSVATLTASNGANYKWYDAQIDGTQLGEGSTFTTPVLSKTTTFYVEAIVDGCTSRVPVVAKVNAAPLSPKTSDITICAGSVARLHADAAAGVIDWFDSPTGGTSLITSADFTTPALNANTTYYVQTTLNDCESSRIPVQVTVNRAPEAPAAQTINICAGTSAVLNVTPSSSGSYQWYDAADGGHLLATSPSYATPVLNYTTTFYVLNINGGCASGRSPVKVVVNPKPVAPSASGAIICPGSATTLSATSASGGTIEWYDSATGGKLLFSGSAFATSSISKSTTFYVQTTSGDCVSARTAVPVTVLPAVAAPFVSPATVCYNNSAILKATGSGTNYEWFDSPNGGKLLSSTQTFVTPELTNTTVYYVQTNANGCESTRTAVTVTVKPLPIAPEAQGTTICSGSRATLTASSPAGSMILWYDAAMGGKLVGTGNTYTTPDLSENTTYYIESSNNNCSSLRTPVEVMVNKVPKGSFLYPSGIITTVMPNVRPNVRNADEAIFSAVPEGLVFANDTTGEINPKSSKPGHYIVTLKSNKECGGSFSAAVDISLPGHSAFGFYYDGPYCKDGINPLPSYIPKSFACVFRAGPGLVFTDPTTGEINLEKSTPGTYIVTVTARPANAQQPYVSTATVTISEPVKVSAGANQIVLSGVPVQLSGRIQGASGGRWSGGVGKFNDPALANAIYTPAAGEHKVVLRITSDNPQNGCGPASDQTTITIQDLPPAPTVENVSIYSGNSTTISATAPGGTYQWYDAPSGGNLVFTGANFITPVLTQTSSYYVQTNLNNLVSPRSAVTVSVNEVPKAPITTGSTICAGQPATLTASGSTGKYQWYDSASGGNLLSNSSVFITTPLTANTSYYVQASNENCSGPRTKVDILVKPVAHVVSASIGSVCSGSAINYTIETDQTALFYSWSREAVPGISNPAVLAQNSKVINETLINTTGQPIDVTYLITTDSCSSSPFKYIVTVNPTPVFIGPVTDTICNKTSSYLQIKFNASETNFSWSRSAVAGITNKDISGQKGNVIREVLFNTTNEPVEVTYLLNYSIGKCRGEALPIKVTVNPSVTVTSSPRGTACSSIPQDYVITSNISSATFSWKRAAVAGISNVAVSDQTSSAINEALINTSNSIVYVNYIITPQAFGCQGPTFTYTVAVNPQPPLAVANSNSPLCLGSTINLRTPTVSNATYYWTGPNGFTSTLQNPDISSAADANAGTYNLYVTVNGCTSVVGSTKVNINQPPHAEAGPDQLVCLTTTAISLNGKITGGTITGVWKSSGTGRFSPANNQLNAQYIPSDEDKKAGNVTLSLASTSKDDCSISTSSMVIKFDVLPAVIAGNDREVCAQEPAIALTGKLLIAGGCKWSSSGTGSFSPSAERPDAYYVPSKEDIKKGFVTLTLLATAADQCYVSTDKLKIIFIPAPSVNAGGIRYVLKNNTITLNPVANQDIVKYKWSPNVDISDVNAQNPVITGDANRLYTLEVTNMVGCISKDSVLVRVSPEITIPNAFTPNGDGVNDFWEIKGLIAYQDATIDVFNRYGLKVYNSTGYNTPWTGNFKGQALPPGTYYYIVNTKVNSQTLSGSVTILR